MDGSSSEDCKGAPKVGTSDMKTEAEGVPGLLSLEKRAEFRGEFNFCLPLPSRGQT